VCEREIPGDFTFDSYFTNAEILNHIHGKRDRFDRPRGYVGDLKFNRKVEWKGSVIRIDEVAAQIDPDLRKTFHRGWHQQWYFTVTLHIPGVNHKARVVIILLMDQLGQTHAKGWALRKLTTIGEACRAVLRETLRSTIAWAIEQATEYSHGLDHITARLRLT